MIFDYIKRGIQYIVASLIIASILVCIFRCFFKKKTTRKESSKWLVVISYFLTIGFIVFGDRNSYGAVDTYRFKYNLYLFENFRIAVRELSAVTVIQQVLNIVMFIPSGGILLWIVGKERWKRIFVYIPLISFTVEGIQFLTGWGLFDVDDLFCNILGGYYGAFLFLTITKKNKWSFIATVLVSTFVAGSCLFYYFMPFGFLPEDVINYQHLKPNTVVIRSETFSQQSLSIYRTIKDEKEDPLPQIEAIFEAIGSAIDYSTKDEFDSCVIYRGVIPTYYLWYNFDGSFQLNMGQKGIPLSDETDVIKNVLLLLDKMGYRLPDSYEVEKTLTGNCKVTFRMEEYKGSVYNGSLEFSYTPNALLSISYGVSEMEYYQGKNAYTEKEIQKNLLQGLFSYSKPINEISCEMEVTNYIVEYERDTKGYYRPVYRLSVTIDGQPTQIITSAISPFN